MSAAVAKPQFKRVIVEVQINQDCVDPSIETRVQTFLRLLGQLRVGQTFHQNSFNDYILRENVHSVTIEASNFAQNDIVTFENQAYPSEICIYKLNRDTSYDAEIGTGAEEEENVTTGKRWRLPHAEFDGFWSSLVFDSNIKDEVLNYSKTIIDFALTNVDLSIISSNKVILFHGPPGTGKTTLCKAVAQKLSIRLSKHYNSFELVEINSHSLFSKWFSESGKLVMKMFDAIKDMLTDPATLVFVLIDEIESLAKARQSSVSNSECSDAIRVVNAILTQIDTLKRHPNVLILTTSNLTSSIDEAFMDRVDLMRFVGMPTSAVIYKILHSCISELQMKSIIQPGYLSPEPPNDETSLMSKKLLLIAERSSLATSGRSLRKVPLLAYASLGCPPAGSIDLSQFLDALSDTILVRQNNHAVAQLDVPVRHRSRRSLRLRASRSDPDAIMQTEMNGEADLFDD